MLPLETKFKLNSFTIAHKDGSQDTFDGSLADTYTSLKDGDSVAYSNLGDKYKGKHFMSWVPVIIDAENMHNIRPIIRKLSKEHGLAVGRLSSKQIVLIFPLDRNFPVAGNDQTDYRTVYQSLLSYYTGVVKNTAKDAGAKLTVHRAPFLKTPKSDPYNFLEIIMRRSAENAEHKHTAKLAKRNATKAANDGEDPARYKKEADQATKKIKHISEHLTDLPYQPVYKYAQLLVGSGSDSQMQYILNSVQYSYVAKHFYDPVFKGNDKRERSENAKEETYKEISAIIYKAYMALDPSNADRDKHFNALLNKAVTTVHPYDGSWDVDFSDITPEPYTEYGLKKEWKLNFHNGKEWTVPTESLMKMIRADVSDVKRNRLDMIMVGKGEKKHPRSGMISNYELELTSPRVCGNVLAYNTISKQIEFLHAFDTEYVHGEYEARDSDGNITDTDRSRAFHLNEGLLNQIMTALEQVEMQGIDKSKTIQAITSVARNNPYDPVTNYLDALPKWDGKERLASMFIDFLGVPDTQIMRKESQIFGIASVYMALNPGAKFDQVFDFVGDQGVGKTSFLQKFFNSFSKKGLDPNWPRENFDWYIQGLDSFTSKDAILSLAGKLCLCDDEMTMSKHTGVETLKEEATMQSHTIRAPYAAMPSKVDRSWIICRTTNVTQNLYHASHGLRKFVPFLVRDKYHKMDCAGPNSKLTPALVDQLWAESYAKYRQLKADGNLISFFSLSDQEESQLKEMRVSLQYIDDLKIDSIGFVNELLKRNRNQWPISFTTRELVEYITGEKRDNIPLSKKLQPILTNDFGFKHTLIKTGRSHKSGYVSTPESKLDLKQLNDDLKK